MNTNIEYKDFEDQTVQRVKEARKIKFKQSSFSVIYNTFKDFLKRKLVNIVDSKLEKAKKDLVDVEFKRGDNLVNYDGTTNKEKILKKKTEAIERLDKILKFLERGNYKSFSSVEEEDSRAIRIKKDMEKVLRANVGSVEKVPEEEKEALMDSINNELNDTKKVIEEETAKVNEKIENIKVGAPEEKEQVQEQEKFNNITVEEVKGTVDKSFEEEAKENAPITAEDVKEAVEEQFKEEQQKEETPVEEKEQAITYEDVEKIANEQFTTEPEKLTEVTPIQNIEKREIGGIQALPQEETEDINKAIFNTEEEKKEETTEEEIREVPVVTPEREEEFVKANEEFKEAEEVYNKIMNEIENEEEVAKEVEETDEKIYEETSEIPEEEKVEEKPVEEKPKKEENIGFDFSDATIEDMKKAAEVTTSPKDLAAMMLKIKMLKKEEERTKEQIKQAQEEEKAKEAKFQETYKMFDDYCNELEAKCNKNLEEKEEIVNRSKAKDEAINKMLSAMDITEESSSKKKK